MTHEAGEQDVKQQVSTDHGASMAIIMCVFFIISNDRLVVFGILGLFAIGARGQVDGSAPAACLCHGGRFDTCSCVWQATAGKGHSSATTEAFARLMYK